MYNQTRYKLNLEYYKTVQIGSHTYTRLFELSMKVCISTLLLLLGSDCWYLLLALIMQRKRHTLPKPKHATEEIYVENELERFCLSDAGLALLAKSCKGLEKLSFIWCSSITSLGLTTVAENCKFLKSVDLQVQFCLADYETYNLSHNALNLWDIYIYTHTVLAQHGKHQMINYIKALWCYESSCNDYGFCGCLDLNLL